MEAKKYIYIKKKQKLQIDKFFTVYFFNLTYYLKNSNIKKELLKKLAGKYKI